ncbi:LPXTG cell wall anchor domain-containing protein [Alkalihalobacillus trypoxylicola]|uniref:Gram-positive cocci surface proteins LPxTG domain-containing protein n=1 Tax=Alkalihalobacillus trypoxylicola TaxID=519424 RepID=A0A161PCD0_9BACI|nr:hypothetical protein AZF04_20035 [Alkalihalobacillus trypoxylicola]
MVKQPIHSEQVSNNPKEKQETISSEKNELPSTSTSSYNLMLLGSILVILGVGLYSYRRRALKL